MRIIVKRMDEHLKNITNYKKGINKTIENYWT